MPTDKKTHCLEDIRMRILTLDISPGSDLDEAALCQQYGISRTPMREVFQRLSGEGYLRLEQNRGAKVASMDLGVLRMFFQTAPLIYANIARLAAENRQPAQIEDLKKTQGQFAMATQTAQAAQAAMLNHRFHAIIGEMAHNPYLVASLSRMLIDHTRLSQTFYRPESDKEQALVKRACDQHDAMICAIEAREPALAIDLTLQHWDLSKDRLERFVTPDPLPLDVISLKERRNAV